MDTIDQLLSPGRRQFNGQYFGRRPLIHKNAIKENPCFSRWSPEYLRSVLGGRTVMVKHSESGLYNISVESQYRNRSMLFAEAIDLIINAGGEGKAYYLQQYSIPSHFPELLKDLETPALSAPTDILSALNFWIGGQGCVTQLHYDRDHNFLVQVRGRKELTLFSPEDSDYLYPNTGGAYAHVSRIQLDQVDTAQFPLFEKATPFHCVLEPGDLLYMPPYWWHQVRSLDMAISVNYWWNRFDISEGMGLERMSVEELCYHIKAFTDNGFSIDHRDDEGEPLLLKAIRKGYANVVEAFLILGASPDQTSVPGGTKKPVLTLARESGYESIVKLLLEYGCNPVADK